MVIRGVCVLACVRVCVCVRKGFLVCFWVLPPVLLQHSIWYDTFDARLLKMLNLVTNAKKSVEILNKYANIVRVINSWKALFNE